MWFSLFLLYCSASGMDCVAGQTPGDRLTPTPEPSATITREPTSRTSVRNLQRPTAELLEDEQENQDNIRQLLGDYDKVRTLSSGSDCICRCTVQPSRVSPCSQETSDQRRVQQESYTVTTETSGSDCRKCECMAPLSAIDPCEAEYRFKRLMEASKDDTKMATIINLLEGSLYGMDLLKLQSVTTKLLSRVDNMEKAFARNFTNKEKERAKERAKEKERKSQQKKKKANDSKLGENEGQRSVPTINKQAQRLDSEKKLQTTTNKTKEVKVDTKESVKDKSSKVIRGWTFYKADGEPFQEEKWKDGLDLSASDEQTVTFRPKPPPAVQTKPNMKLFKQQPTVASTAATKESSPAETTAQTRVQQTAKQPTKVTPVKQPTTPPTTRSTKTTNTILPIKEVRVTAPRAEPQSRLGWTESPDQQPKPTTKPAMCKDTVASISEPVLHNSYGLSDGAWMKDARGHGNVIYLTNGHYGNDLLEFRDMTTFKTGQVSNTYKLPYSYTGTGHVVFNGALYYNRAFSRDVIRYDLRQRYVSAWTTLHDAMLEEQSHRTQTEVEFAVDESGIWLLYPAVDTEGFHQEVILLNHLRSRDLQTIRSFRTGLRRSHYGNSFLVCGVLYGVNSMDRHHANVTYAFDTHTLTHTVPNLAFVNTHSHTSQLAYSPLDKKLYAWDNGHQMTYGIVFAY